MPTICIYEANETDWQGNDLCILQPSSCTVSEIAGRDFGLTLVHPFKEDPRWKELQEERINKAPVSAYKPLENDGTVIVPAEQATEQCFRIYSVSVDKELLFLARKTHEYTMLGYRYTMLRYWYTLLGHRHAIQIHRIPVTPGGQRI